MAKDGDEFQETMFAPDGVGEGWMSLDQPKIAVDDLTGAEAMTNQPTASGLLDRKALWRRPVQMLQHTLFPRPTAEALAAARVSVDDAARWRGLGWLSFDVDRLDRLDEPEMSELAFVCHLARSGLADAQITNLLEGLAKPYRYDSSCTAYSFVYGWVRLPHPDEFDKDTITELLDANVDSWVEQLAAAGEDERLRDLLESVQSAIARHGLEEETE